MVRSQGLSGGWSKNVALDLTVEENLLPEWHTFKVLEMGREPKFFHLWAPPLPEHPPDKALGFSQNDGSKTSR